MTVAPNPQNLAVGALHELTSYGASLDAISPVVIVGAIFDALEKAGYTVARGENSR